MYPAPPPTPKSTPYPMASWIKPPAVEASAMPAVLTAAQSSTSTGLDARRYT
jgi:hypothetical protein